MQQQAHYPEENLKHPDRSVDLLERLRQYRHDDLLYRFGKRFALPANEVKEIFEETKKWLLVIAIAPQGIVPAIHQPTFIIDEMWHDFVLFSKDYEDFCLSLFGKRLFHQPMTLADRDVFQERHARDPQAAERQFREELSGLIRFVAVTLGADTASKWFSEYGTRFNPERLVELQIAALERQRSEGHSRQ